MPEYAASLSPKCPLHVLAHEGFGVRGALGKGSFKGCTLRIGLGQFAQGVAKRHSNIAQPSHMAYAPNGATFCSPQEFSLTPGKKPHQRFAGQTFARIKIRQLTAARIFVPGANGLAIIAAVDAVSDQRTKRFVNGTGMFDGQVRNTPPSIQTLGRDNGLGGADVHAGLAAATVPTHRLGGRQCEIDIDLPQKEHRTSFTREHQRMFAAPALAAAGGELSLQYGRRICEHPMAERTNGLGNPLLKFLKARSQHLVIVTPSGVDRNHTFPRPCLAGQLNFLPASGRGARKIIHPGRDHTHCAGNQLSWPGSLQTVRGHVIHLAVKAVIQPGLQARFCAGQVNARHSDLGKTQFVGPSANTRNKKKRIDLTALKSHPPIVGNMPPLEIYWSSESDTSTFASRMAALPGLHNAYIELHGDLGAGKTTFVRHLLRGLGITGRVKSPTYAVVEPHETPDGRAIWHFDFYRFNDPQEWEDAGFRDLFAASGLKLAEWPEKAAGLLPPADLSLTIDVLPNDTRRVRLVASTPLGLELMEGLHP